MIIGPTGSGKTTLLEALLGDADVASGSIVVPDCVAYVPQQPWVMHGSVRENILFHLPMDLSFFDAVVEGCELKADISALVAGLDTEIGERGVNLSGGQKARISLARAIYSRRSVYLLDDPLSAVDAHVAEALMSNGLLKLLKGTTRVLVTNQVQFLPHADNVVVVGAGGRIEFSGSYDDYQAVAVNADPSATSAVHPMQATELPKKVDGLGVSGHALSVATPTAPAASPAAAKLTQEEEKCVGAVLISCYKHLISVCGGCGSLVGAAAVAAVAVGLHTMNYIWLTLWSSGSLGMSSNWYVAGYCIILLAGACADALAVWVIWRFMRRGGRVLHRSLLESVVAAPLQFFDTTPHGRIVNRFSRDVDQYDNELEEDMPRLLIYFLNFFVSLGVFVVAQPLALFVIGPVIAYFYSLAVDYTAANREVRRVESLNCSRVFEVLSEVLNGTRTIQAFGKSREFLQAALKTLDAKFTTSFFLNEIHRWIDVRMGMIGTCLVTTIALLTWLSTITTVGVSAGIGCELLERHVGNELRPLPRRRSHYFI